MHRLIQGLIFARELAGRPASIPLSRPRGIKAKGLRYEKVLAANLRHARHGVWFEFVDGRGHGHCQPDLLLDHEQSLVVLEAKYTWVPEAHSQIEHLYVPVLCKAYSKTVFGIVVCKVLSRDMPSHLTVTGDLAQALACASTGKRTVLHWIGKSALWPLNRERGHSHRLSIAAIDAAPVG